MRIFCAVRHANDPRHYFGGLWSGNFYPALRRLGYELIESQTDLFTTSRFMHIAGDFTAEEHQERARTTEQILDEIRSVHKQQPVDLFLSYFYNSHFDPAAFGEIQQLGITSVNFYCNSTYQFPLVAEIARKADYSWHPEKNARELYLGVGARPIWVQMGVDPNIYHPVEGVMRKPAACFVGQRYADRDRLLAGLVEAHIPVDIYGAGWERLPAPPNKPFGGHDGFYLGRRQIVPGSWMSYARAFRENFESEGLVGGLLRTVKQWQYRCQTQGLITRLSARAKGRADDVATTLAAYEVFLNFSNVWEDGRPGSALIPHVRLRDFEGPMCRTCYLTGESDEIHEFYEVGKEIDTYQAPEELVEKARFYLGNPDAAERLRESGYRRALRDHTWVKRFGELFGKIQIKSSGPNLH
jgi:spore maturation protein CgeB